MLKHALGPIPLLDNTSYFNTSQNLNHMKLDVQMIKSLLDLVGFSAAL